MNDILNHFYTQFWMVQRKLMRSPWEAPPQLRTVIDWKQPKPMTQWLNALTAPVAWWKPPWDITKSPASHLAWWLAYIIQDDTNSILLHLKQRMRLLTSSSVKSSPVMMRLRIKRVSPIQVQNIRRVWFKNDSSISYQSYRSDKHLEDCNEYDRI